MGTSLRKGDDRGAAKTLNAFLDLCGRRETSHCAFSAGSAAATRAKFAALLKRMPRHPTGSKTTYAELVTGTVFALYTIEPSPSGRPGWSAWAQELQSLWANGTASRDNPDALDPPPLAPDLPLRTSEVAAGATHRYIGPEQAAAVLCSESPNPRADAFRRQDAFAYRRSGAVGPYWSWVPELCTGWPATAADRYAGPWDHRTASPVLVIGNTHDPATDYRASVAMARQLARTRLLTVEGYGHTVLDNPSASAQADTRAATSSRGRSRQREQGAGRTSSRSPEVGDNYGLGSPGTSRSSHLTTLLLPCKRARRWSTRDARSGLR